MLTATNQSENLTQSAELFHLIVENFKDYAIFLTDADGGIISWNPGIRRLFGYAEKEIIGQPISIIFTPEDVLAGAHLQEMNTAAQTGSAEVKRWHQRKDNSRIWGSGTVMPLKNDDGTLRGFAKVMRDDTAQKLTEENLEQVLSGITDSFYRFDRNLRYTYVNGATTAMFGINEDDFLGKTLDELFPDVAGNIFHREVKRALREQETVIFENYYEPFDRWFENRVYPTADGLVVFTSEITQRKRAEQKLRQSEARFRALQQATPDGFMIFESVRDESNVITDFRWVYVNPAVERIIGRSETDLLGKLLCEEMPGNRTEGLFDEYVRVVETGAVWQNEFGYRQENLDHQFLTTAVRVSDGFAVGFSDMTERKKAEEKIRESEENFRDLANSISQLAWMADATGFIFWYNNRWFDYTGTTLEDMQGWGWQTVHHPDELERVTEKFKAHLASGETWEDTFPLRSKTGEYRWFLSRALPIRNENDEIVRWFGTNTDVEELRQARLQAEQANRLKDEFLATLSHELRTPLNAILGWSQMLKSRKTSEIETEKALSIIERSARAQNQLIDDLLDVSRIITGKLRLNVRAVDLTNTITAAVDAARPAAEAKGIRLQILLDPQAEPISGDPDRLQQIVWNILSNAVKFTPKGGRVQVRLERVNSHVEIVISDTGKGIEKEFLPHVFDRFRQSDGSMTRRHGGLGLGLAIVRQLVELHGGQVSVSSEGDGQGATFTVSLPVLPVRREPESKVPRVHPAAQNSLANDCPPELADLRILLVDDEADSRELLTVVLESCRAVVTAAGSAAEALEKFQQAKFDIFISDIGMPGEDGFSLIGKIRNLPNERGGGIPAIALTAYARAEDRVQALRSGFQMHLAKPVESTELVAAVANLAGRMRNPNRS